MVPGDGAATEGQDGRGHVRNPTSTASPPDCARVFRGCQSGGRYSKIAFESSVRPHGAWRPIDWSGCIDGDLETDHDCEASNELAYDFVYTGGLPRTFPSIAMGKMHSSARPPSFALGKFSCHFPFL